MDKCTALKAYPDIFDGKYQAMIEVKHLRLIDTVARVGSLNKAADHLTAGFRTQSIRGCSSLIDFDLSPAFSFQGAPTDPKWLNRHPGVPSLQA